MLEQTDTVFEALFGGFFDGLLFGIYGEVMLFAAGVAFLRSLRATLIAYSGPTSRDLAESAEYDRDYGMPLSTGLAMLVMGNFIMAAGAIAMLVLNVAANRLNTNIPGLIRMAINFIRDRLGI